MVKGWTPISVTDKLAERLEKIYKSDTNRPSSQKFSPWLGEVLIDFVQVQEYLKKFPPRFTYTYVKGTNVIQLFDHIDNEPVVILLDFKNKTMTCLRHDLSDCMHVGFCYGHPATYKILIELGIVPDRRGLYARTGYESELIEEKPKRDIK